MKALFVIFALAFTVQAHATDACRETAKAEGIGQLEDLLDVPCDESSAQITAGPTWRGITSYNITLNCGSEVPNGTWVYLTKSCKDASDDQIGAYDNRGDR